MPKPPRWVAVSCGDPTERAIGDGLALELDEAISAYALPNRTAEALRTVICDILRDTPEDIVETIPLATPGTNNLIVRVRVRRSFYRALARAAQDGNLVTH